MATRWKDSTWLPTLPGLGGSAGPEWRPHLLRVVCGGVRRPLGVLHRGPPGQGRLDFPRLLLLESLSLRHLSGSGPPIGERCRLLGMQRRGMSGLCRWVGLRRLLRVGDRGVCRLLGMQRGMSGLCRWVGLRRLLRVGDRGVCRLLGMQRRGLPGPCLGHNPLQCHRLLRIESQKAFPLPEMLRSALSDLPSLRLPRELVPQRLL